MKKKFNNLNEQVLRMKSLFNDERLYGNIENDEKIITEQYKLFSNIADAFKVSLKSFNQLDTFTKFLNREINNVDDIIKHVDDFEDMWKIIDKNLNTVLLKSNLIKLKKVIELDKLKNISQEELKLFLKGFPYQGGMQDIIYDMWAKSKGLSTSLPQKVDNRVVKLDPKTKEIVIGTSNKGVISYKNKEGKVTVIEKDPEFDSFEYVTDQPTKEDGEDFSQGEAGEDFSQGEDGEDFFKGEDGEDFFQGEDLPENPTVENINGKKINLTFENITKLFNFIKNKFKKGDNVLMSMDDKSFEAFVEKMKSEGIKVKKTSDLNELYDLWLKLNPKQMTNEEKEVGKGLIERVLTNKYSKNFINPFQFYEDTSKVAFGKGTDFTNRASAIGFWGTKAVIRVHLFIIAQSVIDSIINEKSIQAGAVDIGSDITAFWKGDWINKKPIEEFGWNLVKGAVLKASNNKIDCDDIRLKLRIGASDALKGVTDGTSFITCKDIKEKNDEEIIKLAFSKVKDKEMLVVSEFIKKGQGFDTSTIEDIKVKVNRLINFVLEEGIKDNDEYNLKGTIRQLREKGCPDLDQKEIDTKFLKDNGYEEVTVTLVNPETIEQGIKDEIKVGGGDENSENSGTNSNVDNRSGIK